MASGWPLSESAARRQRRKRRRAEICVGHLGSGGPPGPGEIPDLGWEWWGHQAEVVQSHAYWQSFAQDTKSLRDEFLEHVRQTFSEALRMVKAEVGVVAVEGSAAVVRATEDPSTLGQVEDSDRFFTGDMVEVLGLQNARQLNGCRGCVVEILPDRFGVLLHGHAEPKALKALNLRKVPMITQVQEFVDVPQFGCVEPSHKSLTRGLVSPRVAAGNDESSGCLGVQPSSKSCPGGRPGRAQKDDMFYVEDDKLQTCLCEPGFQPGRTEVAAVAEVGCSGDGVQGDDLLCVDDNELQTCHCEPGVRLGRTDAAAVAEVGCGGGEVQSDEMCYVNDEELQTCLCEPSVQPGRTEAAVVAEVGRMGDEVQGDELFYVDDEELQTCLCEPGVRPGRTGAALGDKAFRVVDPAVPKHDRLNELLRETPRSPVAELRRQRGRRFPSEGIWSETVPVDQPGGLQP